MGIHNNLIVDFYKHTGKLPCRHHSHEFRLNNDLNLKAALPIAFKLPPERALEYLRKKSEQMKLTMNWDDMDAEAHDKAFTVAKVMSADLLQEFYNLVEKAKKEGWSQEKFQEAAKAHVDSAGWSGNKMHRLKIIYDTNMNVAYSRGKYQQQMLLAQKGIRPYLKYLPSTSEEKDKLHAGFYNMVLRADDPFWKRYYPPSRHGCKCGVRSLSEKEVAERGLTVIKGSDLIDQVVSDNEMKKLYDSETKGLLKVLDAWEPKTNVYVSGIKEKLDSMLKAKPPEKPVEVPADKPVLNKPDRTQDKKPIPAEPLSYNLGNAEQRPDDSKNVFIIKISEQLFGKKKKIKEILNDADLKEKYNKLVSQYQSILDNAKISIRIDPSSLKKVLESRFKSQFETNKSGGTLNTRLRSACELHLFDYGHYTQENKRPIYGLLMDESNIDQGVQYGEIICHLKESQKNRTTITFGDSLAGWNHVRDIIPGSADSAEDLIISMITSPKYSVANDRGEVKKNDIATSLNLLIKASNINEMGVRYLECQFHGGLFVEDIDKVLLPEKFKKGKPSLLKKLTEIGIKYEFY